MWVPNHYGAHQKLIQYCTSTSFQQQNRKVLVIIQKPDSDDEDLETIWQQTFILSLGRHKSARLSWLIYAIRFYGFAEEI